MLKPVRARGIGFANGGPAPEAGTVFVTLSMVLPPSLLAHAHALPGREGRLSRFPRHRRLVSCDGRRPGASPSLPHIPSRALLLVRAHAIPGRVGHLRSFPRHRRLVSCDGRRPGAFPSLPHIPSRALALARAHALPGREGHLRSFRHHRRQV